MKEQLPPPVEELHELLKERGVSRRDFLKWTSVDQQYGDLNAALPLVAQAAELFNRLPVIWLSFAECTGCAEAFLRSRSGVEEILLETISLEYQENLMAAAGYQAEENLEKSMRDLSGKYICVIEGALQRLTGQFMRIGARGRSANRNRPGSHRPVGSRRMHRGLRLVRQRPRRQTDPTGAAAAGQVLEESQTATYPAVPPMDRSSPENTPPLHSLRRHAPPGFCGKASVGVRAADP